MTKKTQKDLQKDVKESAHKIWLAGLGALATAEEEGGKLFKNLIKKGEDFEKRGKKAFKSVRDQVEDKVEGAVESAESTWSKIGDTFDEKVAGTLKRLGVPTRMEIQKLTRRVEELTRKVDELKPRAAAPKARPSRARTTTSRKSAQAS